MEYSPFSQMNWLANGNSVRNRRSRSQSPLHTITPRQNPNGIWLNSGLPGRICDEICRTDVTDQKQGSEDRGRRERAEAGASCDDHDKAPRKTFTCTTTDPIHRLRDDPPRRQLDEAVQQQDHDLDGLHVHLTRPSSIGSLP
jgi:hypothetical protein